MKTNMASINFESLTPNRALLNAKFDGYQLSSDELAVDTASLPQAVNIVRLQDDVFSHLHVKAFGWTNHLVLDSWSDQLAGDKRRLLYFVDEHYGVNQVLVKDGKVEAFSKVFQIPAVEEEIPHRLHAFVSFPSSSHAIISDGTGQLYVIYTGNRLEKLDWQVTHFHNVGKPFSIVHTSFAPSSTSLAPSSTSLACLLLSVTPDEDTESLHVKHRVLLTVIVFSCEVRENGAIKFGFEAKREFQSHSVPLYGAMELSNQAVLVASEKPFSLVSDKTKDCLDQSFEDTSGLENGNKSKSPKEYTWTDATDDVTIVFPLPEGVKKDDILFDVKTKSLKIALKGGATLLEGELFGNVEADSCTWIIDTQRLEITLTKSNCDGQWIEVVKGDQRGIYRPDGKDLLVFDEIVNPKTGDQASALFNQGQLEECDSLPEDVLYIVRMDLKDGNITQKTSLSTHQWLFTKTIKPRDPPSFCLRHDVDALIWQPHKGDGRVTWNHIGTLDAFGFVHASKKEQKFTSCSPDMTYAVICDVRNYIFTYHRHTVKDVVHAKQKLLQLDNVGSEGIIGVQACNDVIFVLAQEKLYIVNSF